jgi:hypothetical protein
MIEITCKCADCKANAKRLGVEVLGARVPEKLAWLTAKSTGRHGLVHMANDPNVVTGAAARAQTGVEAL